MLKTFALILALVAVTPVAAASPPDIDQASCIRICLRKLLVSGQQSDVMQCKAACGRAQELIRQYGGGDAAR